MARSILILNGPDPDLLGQREREFRGRTALAQAARRGVEECRQSNSEGGRVAWLQQLPGPLAGLRPNAGAYTPTSIALLDAARALNEPLIEMALSNIYQQETLRQHLWQRRGSSGGFGSQGCLMALGALVAMSDNAH
jgi:3-dehydroquinate dehydratase-2